MFVTSVKTSVLFYDYLLSWGFCIFISQRHVVVWLEFWCLTSRSTVFQLYRGG